MSLIAHTVRQLASRWRRPRGVRASGRLAVFTLALGAHVNAHVGAQTPVKDARLTVRTDRPPVNTFDPRTTFGAGIDGHGTGAVADVFTPPNIRAMQSVGFSMATYRLRTELNVQAWHWNPNGRWSDAAQKRGYWTSFDTSTAPILLTHGYRLPRRGTTDYYDDRFYSRLTDGDTATFWKSNPYLAARYTQQPDTLLPQWVIVDLGAHVPVDAMRIRWGFPHARGFKVQYWSGEEVHDVDENPDGRWVTFANGLERDGRGGDELRPLGAVEARFVRIVMWESAHDAAPGSRDPRDSLGYAIRELEVGTLQQGVLTDLVKHGANSSKQSHAYASSTDPWHRAEDQDHDLEQPGFDRVFGSPLTFGRPVMVPVPVLYGVPEDAAAEIRFLRRRGYKLGRIEMGEEPDGQFVTPEDYAALYLQAARHIRAEWPNAPLGGPGFQGLETKVMFAWPNDTTGASWIPRFLRHVRERGRPGDFNFFSFEWYPWDDVCGPTAPKLAAASARLIDRLQDVRADGITRDIPMVMAEYGYSAFSGEPQLTMAAALLNADIVGRFLAVGGAAAFLYGWEPTYLDQGVRCDTWGNNALFLGDEKRHIKFTTAAYHGSRMTMQDWTQARGPHAMYETTSSARDSSGNELVSAYVVRRPDGAWSALVVNKDPTNAYRLEFAGIPQGARTLVSYGSAQYEWKANGANGAPVRNAPPVRRNVKRGELVELPPYTMAVITGR